MVDTWVLFFATDPLEGRLNNFYIPDANNHGSCEPSHLQGRNEFTRHRFATRIGLLISRVFALRSTIQLSEIQAGGG